MKKILLLSVLSLIIASCAIDIEDEVTEVSQKDISIVEEDKDIILPTIGDLVLKHYENEKDEMDGDFAVYCSQRNGFEVAYPNDWRIHPGFWSSEVVGFTPRGSNSETGSDPMFVISMGTDERMDNVSSSIDPVTSLSSSGSVKYELVGDNASLWLSATNVSDMNDRVEMLYVLDSFRLLGEDELCEEKNQPYTVVVKGEIFDHGVKLGDVEDGRIVLSLGDDVYSFEGNPEKLEKYARYHPAVKGDYIYEDSLLIFLPTEVDEGDVYNSHVVKLDCDLPFFDEQPSFYCETDGESYMSLYTFGRAYRSYGSGGGVGKSWYKTFVKSFGGENNVVFQFSLVDVGLDGADEYVVVKEYLDSRIEDIKSVDAGLVLEIVSDSLILNRRD